MRAVAATPPYALKPEQLFDVTDAPHEKCFPIGGGRRGPHLAFILAKARRKRKALVVEFQRAADALDEGFFILDPLMERGIGARVLPRDFGF